MLKGIIKKTYFVLKETKWKIINAAKHELHWIEHLISIHKLKLIGTFDNLVNFTHRGKGGGASSS